MGGIVIKAQFRNNLLRRAFHHVLSTAALAGQKILRGTGAARHRFNAKGKGFCPFTRNPDFRAQSRAARQTAQPDPACARHILQGFNNHGDLDIAAGRDDFFLFIEEFNLQGEIELLFRLLGPRDFRFDFNGYRIESQGVMLPAVDPLIRILHFPTGATAAEETQ
ncbi:MAG TPA: hypothetical protein VLQ88_00055 [Chromatiaceae bacterium]|nr:hypothetical protein [Chromatiaceae bacterium]